MKGNYTLRLRTYIHETLSHNLTHNSFALDATAGNGYDTLFLSRYINKPEHIYAFDIQYQAIHTTYLRLHSNGKLHTTTLFHIGHESLYPTLFFYTKGNIPKFNVVLFNLGYLPHSNKQHITQPRSTIAALTQASKLLAPHGIISIHTYHGHPGGYNEYLKVQAWLSQLPSEEFTIFSLQQCNKKSHHEVVFFVQYHPKN